MSFKTRKLGTIAFVLLAGLLICTTVLGGEIEPGNRQAMPDLHWTDNDGKAIQLSDTSGKPRLLHFWAAWCIPCREEMPQLLQWRKDHPDIDVILLALDERITQSRYFIKKHQLDMPAQLLEPDDADKLGINIVPYTVFVSSDDLFYGHIFGIGDWANDQFSTQVYRQFGLTPAPAAQD